MHTIVTSAVVPIALQRELVLLENNKQRKTVRYHSSSWLSLAHVLRRYSAVIRYFPNVFSHSVLDIVPLLSEVWQLERKNLINSNQYQGIISTFPVFFWII